MFLQFLLKLAEDHPDQLLSIAQTILDLVKANPSLLKDLIAHFAPKPA